MVSLRVIKGKVIYLGIKARNNGMENYQIGLRRK
jgi:hypothetical protein